MFRHRTENLRLDVDVPPVCDIEPRRVRQGANDGKVDALIGILPRRYEDGGRHEPGGEQEEEKAHCTADAGACGDLGLNVKGTGQSVS